jgi:hypothetical protein
MSSDRSSGLFILLLIIPLNTTISRFVDFPFLPHIVFIFSSCVCKDMYCVGYLLVRSSRFDTDQQDTIMIANAHAAMNGPMSIFGIHQLVNMEYNDGK